MKEPEKVNPWWTDEEQIFPQEEGGSGRLAQMWRNQRLARRHAVALPRPIEANDQ